MTKKQIQQAIAFNSFRIVSFSVIAILFIILGFIVIRGFSALSWDFITKMPEDGMTKGNFTGNSRDFLSHYRKYGICFPDRRYVGYLYQ